MEKRNSFKRVSWYGYLYAFLFLCFLGTDIWLWISLSASKKEIDPLLLSMAILCLILTIAFSLSSILFFAMEKEVIRLENNNLIINVYKEQKIPYKDIKDIRYRVNSMSSNARRGLGSMDYKSGTIVITLGTGKIIRIKYVKNVEDVCLYLRDIILVKYHIGE